MAFPPMNIRINSDENELRFVEVNKQKHLIYRYTKSETKLNLLLPLTEEQLLKMIKSNIASEI